MEPGGVKDVMHRKHARRIWGIWEKSVSWVFASEEEGWLSELAEALQRVPRVVGGRGLKLTSFIEECMSSMWIGSLYKNGPTQHICMSGVIYLFLNQITQRSFGPHSTWANQYSISVSWVFASEEEGWLSKLAEALRRVPRVVVGVQMEKSA